MWGLDREIKRIEKELLDPKLSVEMKGVLEARLHQKRRLLAALIEGFGAKPDVSAGC
jgi:hypothetical protein